MNAQQKPVLLKPLPEQFMPLAFGEIKPQGWLKTQILSDLKGFTGNLDQLVPDLIQKDEIYGRDRLTKKVKSKDVGAEGDPGDWNVQFLWWNSETQSNWRDGFVRQAFLSGDPSAQKRAKDYIESILATQDSDGYLGVYAPDLRYKLTGENGELWAKATLYRVLLGYYEATKDPKTWQALLKAVDNVMLNYPIYKSSPFKAEKPFAGLSHGLVFTDVLDRLHQLSGEAKYLEYAVFLYQDYCRNNVSETDIQLHNILDPAYKLKGHGVHSYEHVRPLIMAYQATGDAQYKNALDIYLQRVKRLTTPTGGPIGDEWITQATADATQTGYEYCSIHELLHSYAFLLQKNGDPQLGDQIERLFFNAAQGARHPEKSCIAYLKTDNSYEMTGTKNGGGDPKQTRYKYSPTHQQAAVCCVPNAGRIAPYYIQSMWVKDAEGLTANLLGPCTVSTQLGDNQIQIEEITEYPYDHNFVFKIKAQQAFTLKIRQPEWTPKVNSNRSFSLKNSYLSFKIGAGETTLKLVLAAKVTQHAFGEEEHYFSYGPLVYARPIAAEEAVSKSFPVDGFYDYTYTAKDAATYSFIEAHQARRVGKAILIKAKNDRTQAIETIELAPVGKTILRQVTFK
jgi:DUF1680 family protein